MAAVRNITDERADISDINFFYPGELTRTLARRMKNGPAFPDPVMEGARQRLVESGRSLASIYSYLRTVRGER